MGQWSLMGSYEQLFGFALGLVPVERGRHGFSAVCSVLVPGPVPAETLEICPMQMKELPNPHWWASEISSPLKPG